jgi:hypothetical protein
MNDPHVEYLRNFENSCEPLPEESDWEESGELKDIARELLVCGFVEWNGGQLWLREVVDGLDCLGWLARIEFCRDDESDLDACGKGACPGDAVLAALVQIEVELMINSSCK